MVGLNISLPLFFTALIWSAISSSTGYIAVFKCLGKEYMAFLLEKQTSENIFETTWIWSWTVIMIIFMSNIPDFYLIYSCFKEVESSDENAKNMMSNQAYQKRKR
jgi:hypothetical protein